MSYLNLTASRELAVDLGGPQLPVVPGTRRAPRARGRGAGGLAVRVSARRRGEVWSWSVALRWSCSVAVRRAKSGFWSALRACCSSRASRAVMRAHVSVSPVLSSS
jgi:hypothetical protein